MASTDNQSYDCIAYTCSCAGATVLVVCLATLVLYPELQDTNGVNDAGAAAITAVAAIAIFSTAMAVVACLIITAICLACAALCSSNDTNETNTGPHILPERNAHCDNNNIV